MSARLPIMHKRPFRLTTQPLLEASSPHAGVLATSRAFRSLGLPDLTDTHLPLRKRQRGFTEAQMIESVLLLQTIGGDCPEDIGLLAAHGCLERGLGYRPPKPTAVRSFLELFQDADLEAQRRAGGASSCPAAAPCRGCCWCSQAAYGTSPRCTSSAVDGYHRHRRPGRHHHPGLFAPRSESWLN